jgi:hypothetical protein
MSSRRATNAFLAVISFLLIVELVSRVAGLGPGSLSATTRQVAVPQPVYLVTVTGEQLDALPVVPGYRDTGHILHSIADVSGVIRVKQVP